MPSWIYKSPHLQYSVLWKFAPIIFNKANKLTEWKPTYSIMPQQKLRVLHGCVSYTPLPSPRKRRGVYDTHPWGACNEQTPVDQHTADPIHSFRTCKCFCLFLPKFFLQILPLFIRGRGLGTFENIKHSC